MPEVKLPPKVRQAFYELPSPSAVDILQALENLQNTDVFREYRIGFIDIDKSVWAAYAGGYYIVIVSSSEQRSTLWVTEFIKFRSTDLRTRLTDLATRKEILMRAADVLGIPYSGMPVP